jgi:hypothetical protein
MSDAPRENSPQRKPRRLLAKLALSLVSLLFLFGVAEVALRVIGAKPRSAQVLIGFFKPDANLGWAGRENVSMWFSSTSFNAITSHDADGFRRCGVSTTIESDANHAGEVVWCLGDSFTWSWGVDDEKAWVALLNQMSPTGRIYRNLGSPCFSTYQEYLLLKAQLERGRKPDQVMLVYTSNDLDDNVNDNPIAPHFEVVDGKPQLRNHPVQGRWRCDFRVWLKQNSRAFNYLNFYFSRAKNAVKERFQAAPDVAHAGVPGKPDAAGDNRVIVLREVCRMMQQLCQQHDVDLVVVTHDHDR